MGTLKCRSDSEPFRNKEKVGQRAEQNEEGGEEEESGKPPAHAPTYQHWGFNEAKSQINSHVPHVKHKCGITLLNSYRYNHDERRETVETGMMDGNNSLQMNQH